MKFTCDCGTTFRLSEYPSRDTFKIFGDAELSKIVDQIMRAFDHAETREESFDRVDDLFFGNEAIEKQLSGIECPNCRRLTIIANNKQKFVYRREDAVNESLNGALVELQPDLDRKG